MSVVKKVNSVKVFEYPPRVKQVLGFEGQDCIAGTFSSFTHSWIACGAKLFIISNSDGALLCTWTFGDNSAEVVDITCAVELPIEGCSIPLLIIGISSENTNQICFFNPNTRKIIRTVDVNFPVRILCVIEDGTNEVNPLNDALTKTQGLFAAGCADGSLLLFDLCRGILLKALSGDFGFISDEENSVEIRCMDVKAVTTPAVNQKLKECYMEQNNFAVLLADDCDDGVTALHYSYESAILFVGTSYGSFILWNMSSLSCIFRSPGNNRAIISLSLLEPCDDPRHNLFLWVCYENHPQVVMYCITFSSKHYAQGYGVYYQGFESAGLVYRLMLGIDENIIAKRAINSQSVVKSVSKNFSKTFNFPDGESLQLRLFITSYEIYDKGRFETRAVVFDLNQWYKEQMPDEGLSPCLDTVSLHANTLWHLAVEPSSITHYQWVRPLEQHFHPSSLDFKIWCIEEEGIICFEKLGLQSQWLRNMALVGPSALITPTQVFHGALSAGLLPMFTDPPDPEYTSNEEERKYVLTVCLENRATSVVEQCAHEWSNGGHSVAGCTVPFIMNWLWELHGSYKAHGNRMCIPLFDQSGLRFDVSERRSLQHCKSLLCTVETLYTSILNKYSAHVLIDGIQKKLTAMSLLRFYFDCCLKLISVQLLPEPNELGRPSDSLAYKYDEINAFVCSKRKQGPFLGDNLVGSTGGEYQWEEEGGNGLYPPPSIQAVLRYCLHPAPPLWNKLALMLYLYMDILHSYSPLRDQCNFEKAKNFQYLLRISDVQYKIVTSFWYLDHSLFDEGIALLLDPRVLSVDLSDDQHRSVLNLLAIQNQEKLALQYLRLKAPALHQPNDIRLELELLLSNRLINEAFMFQRKHPELRESLLIQFFKGCIAKKLLGPVFGLHMDPKEEAILLKFLKTSDLKEKGDLQVLLLLSRAKYTEAITLNDRLNSTMNGPRARLETDTRDMIVRGVTGGLNTISRKMATEMRQYHPPPPGTCPKPLSAYIKIRNEPDGPLCQADSSVLLSTAAKSARHLSEFLNSNCGKRKRIEYNDDDRMDVDSEDPPRKKIMTWSDDKDIWPSSPNKFKSASSGLEREVMELVGTPLVKKRGKRFSPHSKPSSILKGKTPEKGLILEDHEGTPRKTLRFALPENEKRVAGRKSLHIKNSTTSFGEKSDVETEVEKIRDRLKSGVTSKLLEDGGIDWRNIAESSKPKVLFSQGISKTPPQPKFSLLDITVSSAERKYLESPSRENEASPVTEAVFNVAVPKKLFVSEDHEQDIQNEVDLINERYLNKDSFMERYKRLRNRQVNDNKSLNALDPTKITKPKGEDHCENKLTEKEVEVETFKREDNSGTNLEKKGADTEECVKDNEDTVCIKDDWMMPKIIGVFSSQEGTIKLVSSNISSQKPMKETDIVDIETLVNVGSPKSSKDVIPSLLEKENTCSTNNIPIGEEFTSEDNQRDEDESESESERDSASPLEVSDNSSQDVSKNSETFERINYIIFGDTGKSLEEKRSNNDKDVESQSSKESGKENDWESTDLSSCSEKSNNSENVICLDSDSDNEEETNEKESLNNSEVLSSTNGSDSDSSDHDGSNGFDNEANEDDVSLSEVILLGNKATEAKEKFVKERELKVESEESTCTDGSQKEDKTLKLKDRFNSSISHKDSIIDNKEKKTISEQSNDEIGSVEDFHNDEDVVCVNDSGDENEDGVTGIDESENEISDVDDDDEGGEQEEEEEEEEEDDDDDDEDEEEEEDEEQAAYDLYDFNEQAPIIIQESSEDLMDEFVQVKVASKYQKKCEKVQRPASLSKTEEKSVPSSELKYRTDDSEETSTSVEVYDNQSDSSKKSTSTFGETDQKSNGSRSLSSIPHSDDNLTRSVSKETLSSSEKQFSSSGELIKSTTVSDITNHPSDESESTFVVEIAANNAPCPSPISTLKQESINREPEEEISCKSILQSHQEKEPGIGLIITSVKCGSSELITDDDSEETPESNFSKTSPRKVEVREELPSIEISHVHSLVEIAEPLVPNQTIDDDNSEETPDSNFSKTSPRNVEVQEELSSFVISGVRSLVEIAEPLVPNQTIDDDNSKETPESNFSKTSPRNVEVQEELPIIEISHVHSLVEIAEPLVQNQTIDDDNSEETPDSNFSKTSPRNVEVQEELSSFVISDVRSVVEIAEPLVPNQTIDDDNSKDTPESNFSKTSPRKVEVEEEFPSIEISDVRSLVEIAEPLVPNQTIDDNSKETPESNFSKTSPRKVEVEEELPSIEISHVHSLVEIAKPLVPNQTIDDNSKETPESNFSKTSPRKVEVPEELPRIEISHIHSLVETIKPLVVACKDLEEHEGKSIIEKCTSKSMISREVSVQLNDPEKHSEENSSLPTQKSECSFDKIHETSTISNELHVEKVYTDKFDEKHEKPVVQPDEIKETHKFPEANLSESLPKKEKFVEKQSHEKVTKKVSVVERISQKDHIIKEDQIVTVSEKNDAVNKQKNTEKAPEITLKKEPLNVEENSSFSHKYKSTTTDESNEKRSTESRCEEEAMDTEEPILILETSTHINEKEKSLKIVSSSPEIPFNEETKFENSVVETSKTFDKSLKADVIEQNKSNQNKIPDVCKQRMHEQPNQEAQCQQQRSYDSEVEIKIHEMQTGSVSEVNKQDKTPVNRRDITSSLVAYDIIEKEVSGVDLSLKTVCASPQSPEEGIQKNVLCSSENKSKTSKEFLYNTSESSINKVSQLKEVVNSKGHTPTDSSFISKEAELSQDRKVIQVVESESLGISVNPAEVEKVNIMETQATVCSVSAEVGKGDSLKLIKEVDSKIQAFVKDDPERPYNDQVTLYNYKSIIPPSTTPLSHDCPSLTVAGQTPIVETIETCSIEVKPSSEKKFLDVSQNNVGFQSQNKILQIDKKIESMVSGPFPETTSDSISLSAKEEQSKKIKTISQVESSTQQKSKLIEHKQYNTSDNSGSEVKSVASDTPAISKINTSTTTFFFGNNDNETYLRASKATFQVGSRASLPNEDEPVNPMEIAMIEEADGDSVEEEEDTDPRNTCMLEVDLSLHLSEDEIVKCTEPKKVDRSMVTTGSYLSRKSRRSSKKLVNKAQKSNIQECDANEKTVQTSANVHEDKETGTSDKQNLSIQTSISHFESEQVKSNSLLSEDTKTSTKNSLATQTSDSPVTGKILFTNTEINKTSVQPHFEEKQFDQLDGRDQTVSDGSSKNSKNLRKSTRDSEIKGILKSKSSQNSDCAKDLRVQASDSLEARTSSKSDAEAIIKSRALRTSYKKNVEDKDVRTDPYEIVENVQKIVHDRRHRGSSVNSQNSEDAKDLRLKHESLEEIKKSRRYSNDSEIHGILKKPGSYEESRTRRSLRHSESTDYLHEKARSSRQSDDISLESKRSLSRHSTDFGLRGILKNKDDNASRRSYSSETSTELRKRLEEDFPEEKRRRRRYSEEPELYSIQKRTQGMSKRSKKSVESVEVSKDFAEEIRRKKSRRQPDEISQEVVTLEGSRKRYSSSHTSDTATDLRIRLEDDFAEEKIMKKGRLSEEPEIQGILKKKSVYGSGRRRSQVSESTSDQQLQHEDDFPKDRRKSRRKSVDEDSVDILYKKHEPARRSRRLSQSNEESDNKDQMDDVHGSKNHSKKSSILSRFQEDGPSGYKKYCDSNSSDKGTDLRVRLEEDFYEELKHSKESERKKGRLSLNTDFPKAPRTKQKRNSLGSNDGGSISNQPEEDFHEAPQSKAKKTARYNQDNLKIKLSSSEEKSEDGESTNPGRKRKQTSVKEMLILPDIIDNPAYESPIARKKSRSLQDFPIRRSTRLVRPILEDIKEEEEDTPRKKRSLDDLDADIYSKKTKSLSKKKIEPKTFPPLVIVESDSDSEESPATKSVMTAEGYAKARRLTRNQKKLLLKNQPLIEAEATPSPGTPSTPRKSRKKTPVPESPPRTPTRASLRLQKKPPSESD